eukprot:9963285-Karenia_brevis.AAC.1
MPGCCARLGWALASVDREGNILASAYGRPPGWIDSIHGAEVWGILMAVSNSFPGAQFRTDCKA